MYTLATGERERRTIKGISVLHGFHEDIRQPTSPSHSHGDLLSMVSCKKIGGDVERMED